MPLPWPIVVFFLAHWSISVFFQSFFLHRYGAHRMFTLSPGWERFFHLCTYISQGSSYLNPRAYAVLHRMHHAYSDTEGDPHSPVVHRNPFTMMTRTWNIYSGIRRGTTPTEARFDGGAPVWPALDRVAGSYVSSIGWGVLYTLFYLQFATELWHFALVPLHYLMGPTHGAIVNYFGHRLGYRNFGTRDASRNTLVFDFLTMGELFQNNHHHSANRPSFAARWFEVDPTWLGVRLFAALGILTLPAEGSAAVQEDTRADETPMPSVLPAAPPT